MALSLSAGAPGVQFASFSKAFIRRARPDRLCSRIGRIRAMGAVAASKAKNLGATKSWWRTISIPTVVTPHHAGVARHPMEVMVNQRLNRSERDTYPYPKPVYLPLVRVMQAGRNRKSFQSPSGSHRGKAWLDVARSQRRLLISEGNPLCLPERSTLPKFHLWTA